MIKVLKIAVDRIKESYENKLNKMEKVIFDYRGKRFEVYEKRQDSFGTKEV